MPSTGSVKEARHLNARSTIPLLLLVSSLPTSAVSQATARLVTVGHATFKYGWSFSGQVRVAVSVEKDGRVSSASIADAKVDGLANDGDLEKIRAAAVESARASRYSCRHCQGTTPLEVTYFFEPSPTIDLCQSSIDRGSPVWDHVKARVKLAGDQVIIQGQLIGACDLQLFTEISDAAGDKLLTQSLDTLRNPSAPSQAVAHAAKSIALRSDIRIDNFDERQGCCSLGGLTPPSLGESLRQLHDPSVTDLLHSQFVRFAAIKTKGEFATACQIADALNQWDPPTAFGLLTESDVQKCVLSQQLVAARLAQGDQAAAFAWTERIRAQVWAPFAARIRERSSWPDPPDASLALLWMFPENPAFVDLSKALFTGKDAPLTPGQWLDRIPSQLLLVPAFRQAVLDGLRDSSVVAQATRYVDGTIVVLGGRHGWQGSSKTLGPTTKDIPVRRNDFIAWQLSHIASIRQANLASLTLRNLFEMQFREIPEFSPDWPKRRRDRAVAQITKFLTTNAKRLRAFPGKPADLDCIESLVYFVSDR